MLSFIKKQTIDPLMTYASLVLLGCMYSNIDTLLLWPVNVFNNSCFSMSHSLMFLDAVKIFLLGTAKIAVMVSLPIFHLL